MRLLFIGFNMPYFGTFRRSSQWGREMVRRGHDITLIVTSPNRRFGIKESNLWGMKLIETPDIFSGQFRSGWDPWNIANRLRWLQGKHFDAVHAFECRPAVIYPALFANKKGIPLIIDWSDWFGSGGSVEERPNPIVRSFLRPIETFFENQFRPQADANTVICSTLYKKALTLGIPETKLLKLPIGCDPDLVFPVPAVEARLRLGLPVEGPYVGYLGSAFLGDAEFIATSFSYLQMKIPSVRLLWFGAGPQKSQEIVEKLNNTHIVKRFVQEKMIDYLNAVDVGWLPLRDTPANWGRWPSKFNEFLSAGRPVISTSVGDMVEVFERWPVGKLSLNDPISFAEATYQLISNPQQMLVIGKEARRLAENELSIQYLCDELLSFYQRVI